MTVTFLILIESLCLSGNPYSKQIRSGLNRSHLVIFNEPAGIWLFTPKSTLGRVGVCSYGVLHPNLFVLSVDGIVGVLAALLLGRRTTEPARKNQDAVAETCAGLGQRGDVAYMGCSRVEFCFNQRSAL